MFKLTILMAVLTVIFMVISKMCKTGKDDDRVAYTTFHAVWIGTACTGVLFFVLSCFTIVPAGHVGIVDVFGSVSDTTLDPGINFVNPVASVVKMNTQTQEAQESMASPTKEGLSVLVDVSVIYHLDARAAAAVYKTVGKNYIATILEPQSRSITRGITTAHEAKSLYSSERDLLAQAILKELVDSVGKRGVIVESVLLRQISLPEGLAASITTKLQADQESQRMEFVLLKEKQEAERKRIEAQGIADFQKIVTLGISEPLLRWKGIEATEKLAMSANTKVVVIGGKDGLPLILNSDK